MGNDAAAGGGTCMGVGAGTGAGTGGDKRPAGVPAAAVGPPVPEEGASAAAAVCAACERFRGTLTPDANAAVVAAACKAMRLAMRAVVLHAKQNEVAALVDTRDSIRDHDRADGGGV